MKIGVKLVVVISLVNLIGIGLLAGVTLIQSQREISRLADEEAQNIARESGERISKWFEGHIGTTRTMAQIMEGYQDIPVAERRDFFNMMMRQVLTANSRLLGMYRRCKSSVMQCTIIVQDETSSSCMMPLTSHWKQLQRWGGKFFHTLL